ncbi:pectinesterase/pectinesterase inhibitor [Vigna angularis]|uniref:pectinesterase/pectinesterase inhibitor n=1 Tax=Phaseolus angularis TaxID=3914 RepID=UPI00080A31DF|nr:pectinesterase/pectinesterase inhibitor [Vigna angularis]
METHQSLLDNPRKSVSKTICLIFSVAVVLTSSALIASYISKPSPLFNHDISHRVCDHAIDPSACLAHVLEVEQDPMFGATQNHRFGLLKSFLMKSTSHIERVIGASNAMRVRMNNPGEEAALRDCVELMELSVDRVWDSKANLTKGTTDSAQDAHTWLRRVLTNHVTYLEGLKGRAPRVMEAEVQDLISRARSSLAMFVAVLPPNPEVEVVSLIERASFVRGSTFSGGDWRRNERASLARGEKARREKSMPTDNGPGGDWCRRRRLGLSGRSGMAAGPMEALLFRRRRT